MKAMLFKQIRGRLSSKAQTPRSLVRRGVNSRLCGKRPPTLQNFARFIPVLTGMKGTVPFNAVPFNALAKAFGGLRALELCSLD